MKVRFSFVLLAAAVSAPTFAQPAPAKRPTPTGPTPALGPKAAEAADDPNAFERDLDALFSANGLTADQAAARAAAVSPTVQRRIAEVEAQIAGAEATELQQVPQIGGKLQYTRNSRVPAFTIPFGGMDISIPSSLVNNYVAEANVNINLSDYIYRYPKLVKAAKLGLEVAKTSKASAMVDAGQDARSAILEGLRHALNVGARRLDDVVVRGDCAVVHGALRPE